jgi:misacylated tRNA(Ala) deacylase
MESGQPKSVDPRMHSAEHILSGTMVRLYGCARPFTTHLEKKKSKVDIQFPRPLTQEELSGLERRVNEVIALGLPVWEELLDRPEAARRFDLGRLPDSAGETVRIIHIGEYDACPCSGSHVGNTAEIGLFRMVSASHEEGGLRIRFKLSETTGGPSP